MDLTALFTFMDDFFKENSNFDIWIQLHYEWINKQGPQKKLSISETVTLNVLRFQLRFTNLKTFHRLVKDLYSKEFPSVPNYENFPKATNKSSEVTLVRIRYLLYINRSLSNNGNHFIDSTPLSVCYNYNIYSHKVNKVVVERGKSINAWFYCFKLHGVCNECGKLENILFTPGNVHDSKTLEFMASDIKGTLTCDAGYLVKDEILEKIFSKKLTVYITTRRNMKRIMTSEQNRLFKTRSVIETVWGVLKERFNLMYNLARSTSGLFRHYFYSITTYMLEDLGHILLPSA